MANKSYLVKVGTVEAGSGKTKRAVEAGGVITLSEEAGASLVAKRIVEEVAGEKPAKQPTKEPAQEPAKEPAK